MIKQGILNADLRSLTARIGHRDRFAIVDAGYNIPLGIETVDLAFCLIFLQWFKLSKEL